MTKTMSRHDALCRDQYMSEQLEIAKGGQHLQQHPRSILHFGMPSIGALWFKCWPLEETETSLYCHSMSPGYITFWWYLGRAVSPLVKL